MKILTILGTRPEIIRLSIIMNKLDKICNHRILYTGQNYDKNLSDIFFKDLDIRTPDVILNCKGSLSAQLSDMFIGVEKELLENRPDKVLILGDTNSGLSSIICERHNIPVYHMEAGNRCFDLKVPEERNRKLIDHTCSYNLPYTNQSKENLLNEGIHKSKILVTGNPIAEVLVKYVSQIDKSDILDRLCISSPFCLATIHRNENVSSKERLESIINGLNKISKYINVIFPCHPKTKDMIFSFGIDTGSIKIIEPLGFFDFVKLEKTANLICTDSGTVLEESAIFKIPTLVLRDSTERPECFESGSAILSGINSEDIYNSFIYLKSFNENFNEIPKGYEWKNVSDIVVKFLLSKGL